MNDRGFGSNFDGVDEGTPQELLGWNAFISAQTAESRCSAWLALVCQRVVGAQAAAILIENTDDQTYVPIAVWPKAGPDLARLSGVVELALKDRQGVVKHAPEPSNATHMAYPLLVDDRIAGVVALEVICPESEIGEILREVHWGSAWLANLLAARELSEAIRGKERVSSVLSASVVALRHGKMQQALFELTNYLRQYLGCVRVALGLVNEARVKLVALSEAATFERQTSLVKAYEQAMEEAYDEGGPVILGGQEVSSGGRKPKHESLIAVSGVEAVMSFPMMVGARYVAVLTLERQGNGFSPDDQLWIEAFCSLAAPIIEQRRDAERGPFRRFGQQLATGLEKLFGPRHLTWKTATAAIFILIALLVLVPIEYRVSAKTVIEGEVQRVVAAPFEGFISIAAVRAGDIVKADQILAQLDDRELRIEEARWSSEKDQYDNRLREAMAGHDLTAMQVVGAQLHQAEAQLALVTEKIAHSRLKAPFDGIVVSGDLSQQIGAPVETGKKLFEVAPLQSYRVILQVDEHEIRHIQIGQNGRLVMMGIAGAPMPFKVAKVTPVATAQEGKNFFRVEALLSHASSHLRPGMEGIGKIEIGQRSIWWVLTHSFSDWLVLTLWTWLP